MQVPCRDLELWAVFRLQPLRFPFVRNLYRNGELHYDLHPANVLRGHGFDYCHEVVDGGGLQRLRVRTDAVAETHLG